MPNWFSDHVMLVPLTNSCFSKFCWTSSWTIVSCSQLLVPDHMPNTIRNGGCTQHSSPTRIPRTSLTLFDDEVFCVLAMQRKRRVGQSREKQGMQGRVSITNEAPPQNANIETLHEKTNDRFLLLLVRWKHVFEFTSHIQGGCTIRCSALSWFRLWPTARSFSVCHTNNSYSCEGTTLLDGQS